MSDPKVDGPKAPAAWELPDAERPVTAERSFNDDEIGARAKQREAAQAQLAADRLQAALPRQRVPLHQKVDAARGKHPLDPGPEASGDAAAGGRGGRAGRAGAAARRRGTAEVAAEPAGLDGLARRLSRRLEAWEALWPETSAGQAQLDAITAEVLAGRRLRAEQQVRLQLMAYILGPLHAHLLADPRLTFRRLFDRLGRWPRRLPPGRRPASEADFDAFLAWVFGPPPLDPTIDIPFALTGR